MANLILYPPSGILEDAKSLKFEISEIGAKQFRINMENATHGVKVDIGSFQRMDNKSCMGVMNLNIPEHSSQAAISIFAHIEEKQSDGSYKTAQICPSIFSIKDEASEFSEKISITPSFIGMDGLCSIHIVGKPNSKSTISINDKLFRIIINKNGTGSINFKGRDVVGSNELSAVRQMPVYLYSEEDNYTNKKFTNLYLNVLPQTLAMHAAIDPRCNPADPAYVVPGAWSIPGDCIEAPVAPEEIDIGISVPSVGLPMRCAEGSTASVSLGGDADKICKIFHNSVTLLNNGMALHAYTSPDKNYEDAGDPRFNINKVFVATQKTVLDNYIVANKDVVIAPKEPYEDFQIHVSDDIWNALQIIDSPSVSDIYVVLFNAMIGFQRIKIVERTTDEYTGVRTLTGEVGNTNVKISNWLFCVNAVFYRSSIYPSLYLDGITIPYIRDGSGNYLQTINISVASNSKYVGLEEETYVYLIAEAVAETKSQLFFYSFSAGRTSLFDSENYGWEQLTDTGNNKNPRAYTDSINNLHIVWESNRGDICQIYYGVIGPSSPSLVSSSVSSYVDKYAEFSSTDTKSFSSIDIPSMERVVGSGSNPIPEYETSDLVPVAWAIEEDTIGSVTERSSSGDLNDLLITVNPVDEEAMAFLPLEIVTSVDNPSVLGVFPYSQFNYQMSFKLAATVNQSNSIVSDDDYNGIIIEEKEIDKLFDSWKDGFTVSIDENVDNQPVYVKNNNKFVIGKSDNIFDRIIPIIGSYKDTPDPSTERFRIEILKSDNNLKDFSLGLLFEKSYFRATNIETPSAYYDRGYGDPYTPEETEVIFTGRAKLVVLIKTEDISDERSDYIIVREFPEILEINELSSYTIILNYKSIGSDEVANVLDTYDRTYNNKFIGTITLLIDDAPKFSQSFISTLSDDYNYFDLGFGVPYGGYYVADKMSPSKFGVFENVSMNLEINDVRITSPTFAHNSAIINLPVSVQDSTELRVIDESSINLPDNTTRYNPSNNLLSLNFRAEEDIVSYASSYDLAGNNFYSVYDVEDIDKISVEFDAASIADRIIIAAGSTVLYDTGFISTPVVSQGFNFDVDIISYDIISVTVESGGDDSSWSFIVYFKKIYSNNGFLQVPITIEGINQSVDVSGGTCNDLHLSWQSNRDRYWNIFYTNSVDKLSPFRYDTKITNTESNSLRPSVSVNRNGSRMITWHDDRDGNYNIYAARSLSGYSCDEDKCERKMLDAFKDYIVECLVSFEFEVDLSGAYNFSIEFYHDSSLTNLYKTISIEGAENRWFLNGDSMSLSYDADDNLLGVVLNNGDTVSISYRPHKDDEIFDMVLYAKLLYSVT